MWNSFVPVVVKKNTSFYRSKTHAIQVIYPSNVIKFKSYRNNWPAPISGHLILWSLVLKSANQIPLQNQLLLVFHPEFGHQGFYHELSSGTFGYFCHYLVQQTIISSPIVLAYSQLIAMRDDFWYFISDFKISKPLSIFRYWSGKKCGCSPHWIFVLVEIFYLFFGVGFCYGFVLTCSGCSPHCWVVVQIWYCCWLTRIR